MLNILASSNEPCFLLILPVGLIQTNELNWSTLDNPEPFFLRHLLISTLICLIRETSEVAIPYILNLNYSRVLNKRTCTRLLILTKPSLNSMKRSFNSTMYVYSPLYTFIRNSRVAVLWCFSLFNSLRRWTIESRSVTYRTTIWDTLQVFVWLKCWTKILLSHIL